MTGWCLVASDVPHACNETFGAHPREVVVTGDRTIDIVIADDHPVVMAGLAALLAGERSGCRIVARCADAESALAAIREHGPAVALVKLELAGSFDLLRRMRQADLACAVVLFGAKIEERQALDAIRLGARGLLLKTLPGELIEECVRKVARGERWIEKESAAGVMDRLATAGSPNGAAELTPRETQLAKLAAAGLRNREIASRVGISVGTVKIHLHNIYRKLDVRGRVQLAHRARERGLF